MLSHIHWLSVLSWELAKFLCLLVRWRPTGVIWQWISNYLNFLAGWGTPAVGNIEPSCSATFIILWTYNLQHHSCGITGTVNSYTMQRGCAMAEVISCQPLTTETLVKSQANLCGIYSGQNDKRTGFPPSTLVLFHQCSILIHSSLTLYTLCSWQCC
jgi:hypothetical protein